MGKPHRGDAERREGRKCIAEECPQRVENDRVFCDEHWKKIPIPLQQKLGELYKHGQFDDLSGVMPSHQWLKVARRAVTLLASQDKRKRQKDEQSRR